MKKIISTILLIFSITSINAANIQCPSADSLRTAFINAESGLQLTRADDVAPKGWYVYSSNLNVPGADKATLYYFDSRPLQTDAAQAELSRLTHLFIRVPGSPVTYTNANGENIADCVYYGQQNYAEGVPDASLYHQAIVVRYKDVTPPPGPELVHLNSNVSLEDNPSALPQPNKITITLQQDGKTVATYADVPFGAKDLGEIKTGQYHVIVSPNQIMAGPTNYDTHDFEQTISADSTLNIIYTPQPPITVNAHISGFNTEHQLNSITLNNTKDLSSNYTLNNVSTSGFTIKDVLPGTYTVDGDIVQEDSQTYCPDENQNIDIATTPTTQNIDIKYINCTPKSGGGKIFLTVSNDRTFIEDLANSAFVLTLKNSVTGDSIKQDITLHAGVASKLIEVPNGVYTLDLAPKTKIGNLSDYDLVSSATNVVVENNVLPLNLDYKYKGSYAYINAQDYGTLLPSENAADINIGENDLNGFIQYHCNYLETPNGLQRDLSTCVKQNFSLNNVASHQKEGFSNDPKQLAMSVAFATMLERISLQYAFPEPTIKDVPKGFTTIGDYLNENFEPNFFISRCIQETGTCEFARTGSSGPFQIDSLITQLPQAEQGLPFPFALIPFDTLDNKLRYDFVGGVIASVYFDISDYGIIRNQSEDDGGKLANLQQLISTSNDKLAAQRVAAWAYNRGAYSYHKAYDQNPDSSASYLFANLDHCIVSADMINDPLCYPIINDWGPRYIRQLPNVAHELSGKLSGPDWAQGVHWYDVQLTWDDVANFIDSLGPANFAYYDVYDVNTAKAAAQKTFEKIESPQGTIDFRTQFSQILKEILTSLPVYQWGVATPSGSGGGDTGGHGNVSIMIPQDSELKIYIQATLTNGDVQPGQSIKMRDDEDVKRLATSSEDPNNRFGRVDCQPQALTDFATFLHEGDKTINVSYHKDTGCVVTTQ